MDDGSSSPPGILVVEDDPAVGRLTTTALQKISEDVTLVETGIQALDACAKREFDVVVSDMKMPGMSGLELLKVMETTWPGMRRILATGDRGIEIDQANTAEHIVINRLLTKPWNMAQLIDAVNDELGHKINWSDIHNATEETNSHGN